ncbi:MAG: aldo/keto reductase [Dehalococcoidia bacterium]|nr:aldo/keto reductase [Dehalococcoidia bacterium]
MNYRKLGQTGLEVSEIGFGAWGIGGGKGAPAYGATDDRESKAALRRAYELGVTFYDTSDFYGFGHSERLIGETLGDVRSQVVLATKVGVLNADWAQDFSANHIRESLDASLRRLQTDYIDLYQLHSPSIDVLAEDEGPIPVLHALREEGKIRALGISVASPGDGLAAVSQFGFNSVQVNFNLVDQRALENGLFDLAQSHGAGIVVRTPLCFGFLTGAYTPETEFDATDHRRQWPEEQKRRWAGAGRLFSDSILNNTQQTESQLALRFCLSYDSVSTAIPGMLTSGHVEENVQASQMGPFSETELLKIEQTYRETVFYVGR